MSLSSARVRLGVFCAAALLCGLPAVRADDTEATIRLKHVKPSEFSRLILAPSPSQSDASTAQSARIEGLKSVSPDDAASLVMIRGDKAGVEQAKALARLMDIAVPIVRLQVQVLRCLGVKGEKSEIVARAVGETEAGKFCELKAIGGERLFLMRFRPQVTGDNRVTLFSDVSMTAPYKPHPLTGGTQDTDRLQGAKRISTGRPINVLTLTSKRFVTESFAPSALYIEVIATIEK